MICFKKIFVALMLVFIFPQTQAGLIDLGVADKYTFAIGQYDHYGSSAGGNLNLGSEALIHGNVAASNFIGFGAGSFIYGDACAPNINNVANVQGSSSHCSDVIKQDNAVFDQLSLDIATANKTATNMGGVDVGKIDHSTTFQASQYSALAISSIHLSTGEFLTINGSSDDEILLNIADNALLGSGAGILLTGGLSANNVVFNFASSGFSSFEFGGADISGTFLANKGTFIAGDGATLDDVRFYTNQALIANVQTVKTLRTPIPDNTVEVPEPSSVIILMISLAVLVFSRSKNVA